MMNNLAVILFCAGAVHAVHGQIACTGVGFYPDPEDCSTFYRCTDLYGNGLYQRYLFQCPLGTVFDDILDVCNWPWAVPGCNGGTAPPLITSTQPPPTTPPTTPPSALPTSPAGTEPTAAEIASLSPESSVATGVEAIGTTGATGGEATTPAAYLPSAESQYDCRAPGVVEYKPDCQKFWLCKENPAGSRVLEALLYRCPVGYIFSSSSLRCARAQDISCLSSAADTRSGPVYQLYEADIESFFNRWG